MQVSVRRGPSAAFLFVLFCFALPFVSFSCPGVHLTVSGLQMATGKTFQQPQIFGPPQERRLPPEPITCAAFLCAVAGLLASFLPSRRAQAAAGLFGGLGALLLYFLRNRVNSLALTQGGGLLEISFEIGYWLALVSFLAAAVLAVMILGGSPRTVPAAVAKS